MTRTTATLSPAERARAPELDGGPTDEALPSAGALREERSLSSLARRGVLWSVIGYGGSQALRFAVNLLLTRLLLQEAFGLLALVSAFLQGLQLFSDVGLGLSIIQNKRGDDRDFLNTAWTLQVARGACLALATCACAAPFASFYGDASLRALLVVSGTTALLSGFNSTKLFTMNRQLSLARLTMIELASQIAGLAVMVAWAYVDPSPWALVSGGVVGAILKMALSHAALPGIKNRFRWEKDAAHSLLRFGRWVFLSTVLTFLVTQSDRLIFGKMIPLDLLGVYSIAGVLASMPVTAIGQLAGSVVFPMYSRIVNAGEALAPAYLRVRWPLLLVSGWMLSGLIAGGPTIVDLLYDQRYSAAGWIVQLLCLGSWLYMLESSNGSALLAQGRVRWLAFGNVSKLVGMLVLIPLGYWSFGFPGAVAGFAASESARYAVSIAATRRAGLRGWVQDLQLTALGLVAIGAGTTIARVLAAGGAPAWACAASVFASVTLVWAPAALRSLRAHGLLSPKRALA